MYHSIAILGALINYLIRWSGHTDSGNPGTFLFLPTTTLCIEGAIMIFQSKPWCIDKFRNAFELFWSVNSRCADDWMIWRPYSIIFISKYYTCRGQPTINRLCKVDLGMPVWWTSISSSCLLSAQCSILLINERPENMPADLCKNRIVLGPSPYERIGFELHLKLTATYETLHVQKEGIRITKAIRIRKARGG